MSDPPDRQPPGSVAYGLEDALELLAALEDAREVLGDSDHLAVLAQIEHQVALLSRKLGFNDSGGEPRA